MASSPFLPAKAEPGLKNNSPHWGKTEKMNLYRLDFVNGKQKKLTLASLGGKKNGMFSHNMRLLLELKKKQGGRKIFIKNKQTKIQEALGI